MSITNLEDLFIHELRDVLDAERQITKALPKMVKAASSEELKAAFQAHHDVTEQQVERLQKVFEGINKVARGKHCAGMEGLLTEGEQLIKEEDRGATLDAALICAAQKVEHYEIAAYGSLVTYAQLLGRNEAVDLLNATLDEEKETDQKLTNLASSLNLAAEEQAA
jgi:ferritin-like metal-binding protein YciE